MAVIVKEPPLEKMKELNIRIAPAVGELLVATESLSITTPASRRFVTLQSREGVSSLPQA